MYVEAALVLSSRVSCYVTQSALSMQADQLPLPLFRCTDVVQPSSCFPSWL